MSAVNKPDSAGSTFAARVKSLAPGVGLSVVITLLLALQRDDDAQPDTGRERRDPRGDGASSRSQAC